MYFLANLELSDAARQAHATRQTGGGVDTYTPGAPSKALLQAQGRGTEEASTHTGRPFDAPPRRRHPVAPLHEVCVVYSEAGCGLRSFGPSHPLPPLLTLLLLDPTPSVERTRRSRRGHWWSNRRPPRVSPPPHHLPFIPTTHPTTMQGQPHLLCQHRMGVASTAPFTHPHHHTSHLSHSPRWRCHRSVGTTPHYLADQHWSLPPQTHAGHIPHHALSRPPLQAQGGREVANRQCEPGVSTHVRVNRSGPRVVRAVGRRRARSLLGIVLWCEHNPNAANLGGAG